MIATCKSIDDKTAIHNHGFLKIPTEKTGLDNELQLTAVNNSAVTIVVNATVCAFARPLD